MKTIKFIGIIIVAAIVGLLLAAWADEHHVGYRYAFVAIYLFGSIAVYYCIEWVIAALTRSKQTRFDTIRHKTGGRSYGQAAIFVGAACVFMGTPKDCEELADDLWHHGQQAEVRAIDGTETFDIL